MTATKKRSVSTGSLPLRPAAFTFFRQLARNNNKPWFEEHRTVYEQEVKGPLRDLVEEVDVRLAQVAPEFVGDPKRGAEAVGAHKTSMLQDLEAGRPLEIEPLVGVVIELGRLTNTPTPSIDAVYACVKLMEASGGM